MLVTQTNDNSAPESSQPAINHVAEIFIVVSGILVTFSITSIAIIFSVVEEISELDYDVLSVGVCFLSFVGILSIFIISSCLDYIMDQIYDQPSSLRKEIKHIKERFLLFFGSYGILLLTLSVIGGLLFYVFLLSYQKYFDEFLRGDFFHPKEFIVSFLWAIFFSIKMATYKDKYGSLILISSVFITVLYFLDAPIY